MTFRLIEIKGAKIDLVEQNFNDTLGELPWYDERGGPDFRHAVVLSLLLVAMGV